VVLAHTAVTAITLAMGFSFTPYSPARPNHWDAGLATCILTLLVHSVVLTYFVGTGRWVREVSEVYGFALDLYAKAWKTKARAIPFAMGSMLVIIAAGAMGAAADPGATVRLGTWMGVAAGRWHLISVLAALAFNTISYWMEYRALEAHALIIDQVMHQVAQVRAAHGAAAAEQNA
jgi:hypothetical protein